MRGLVSSLACRARAVTSRAACAQVAALLSCWARSIDMTELFLGLPYRHPFVRDAM